MILQYLQDLRQGMQHQGMSAVARHAVEQEGQAEDVVEVGMGQEHMVDLAQGLAAKSGDAGPRIHQDIVVDQKSGGMAAITDAPGTAQNFDFHGFTSRLFGCVGEHAIPLGRGWVEAEMGDAVQIHLIQLALLDLAQLHQLDLASSHRRAW